MKKFCKQSSLLLALAMIGSSLVLAAGEKPARPGSPENVALAAPSDPAALDAVSDTGLLSALGPIPPGPTTRPTPADIESLKKFLGQNAPNHSRVMRLAEITSDAAFWTREVQRYHAYQSTDQVFPELAKIRLKRLKYEDDLLPLVIRIRRNPARIDDIRPQIHQIVQDLENNKIEEQKWRVGQLKSMIDDSQKKLDAEEHDRDKLVEDRTNRILERARKPRAFEANRPDQSPGNDDLPPTTNPTKVK